MTLEQLVGYTIEELESLSDAELHEKLKPFFSVSRPDPLMNKNNTTVTKPAMSRKQNSNYLVEQAQRELEKLGIKI